jgi:diaminopimelate decarboxylase
MMPTDAEQRGCSQGAAINQESSLAPGVAPLPDAPRTLWPSASNAALEEIARQYGTPTYAYDLGCIAAQIAKLRANLPTSVDILYSLKANASLGLCAVMARQGLGADVASAGELVTARAAGNPPSRIVVTGPDKSPAVLAELRSLPEIVLSLDSVSELQLVAEMGLPHRVLLRLRPDFCSYATCSAGPDSRFGLTLSDLPACRQYLATNTIKLIGFHVFSGSQVLANDGIVHHLRGGVDLALRAAKILGVTPKIVDIGGGFGIPYGPGEQELDLDVIGRELHSLAVQAAPARLVIELGRYLVAQAGWYLTSVIAEQTFRGRRAVVVDGGSHQRADLCGVGLRQKVKPVVLESRSATRESDPVPGANDLALADVLGCLSLPADILAEAVPLPRLTRGDVLAFPNAGAYGLYGSPCLFHAHAPPAEVAFEGTRLELLRPRKPVRTILDGQTCPVGGD